MTGALALAAWSLAFAHPAALGAARPFGARRASGPRCCAVPEPSPAPLPKRQVDSRGFVVPEVGDVVKMPSKWAGEWDVGQVDFVQFVAARGAFEVDLLPLKDMGSDMYRMPGKKPSPVRVDVAKLGRLRTASYVAERDAYRVDPAELEPMGGRKVADPDVTAQGLAEYAELKTRLLVEAALLGLAGSVVALPLYGADVAGSFAAGVAAGCIYLVLLSKQADGLGGEDPGRIMRALVGGRLAVPAVLLAAIALKNVAASGGPLTLGLVTKEEYLAVVAGFLLYKAPLLARQVARAFEEMRTNEDAQAPLTASAMPVGSLGVAFKLAQANLKKTQREAEAAEAAAGGATAAAAAAQVVICGPSGVGKSSLIARLLEEQPARYGFSVSCTTRKPRQGEAEGVDYYFKTDAEFDAMVAGGEFVEWAKVGGQRYGTSVAGVEAVGARGQLCVLDLDVQGVQALRGRGGLRPYCVWVAPPSLDALRARLRARGTEDNAQIEARVARATTEIEFSLTARCFDKIVLNEELDVAYAELREALDAV